jgi:isoleucyl-tRNA synthetase
LGDELRFVLITSSATIKPLSDGESAAQTAVDGLRVSVSSSAYEKCGRCWHHREDVGAHSEHTELCGRCVSNVEGDGEAREFA